MKFLSLAFIELKPDIWNKAPVDRPFSALAADALGSERRIRKGVNLGRERSRYTQLCNWIELSAAKLLFSGNASGSLVLSDSSKSQPASDYLRLIEVLRSTAHPSNRHGDSSSHATEQTQSTETKRPQPIGMSFYPPGDCVAEQVSIFATLSVEMLQSLIPSPNMGMLTPFMTPAKQKAEFYERAQKRKSGVVEVLMDLPR